MIHLKERERLLWLAVVEVSIHEGLTHCFWVTRQQITVDTYSRAKLLLLWAENKLEKRQGVPPQSP
jgi:hypothetical protein